MTKKIITIDVPETNRVSTLYDLTRHAEAALVNNNVGFAEPTVSRRLASVATDDADYVRVTYVVRGRDADVASADDTILRNALGYKSVIVSVARVRTERTVERVRKVRRG